jgi:hypothetical protein
MFANVKNKSSMELENKVKCVLMDFEINEITLQEATKRILLLLDVVGQGEQLKCRCIKEEINKNSSDMKNLKEQFLEILEDDHTPSIEKADKLLVLFGVSTRTFHVGDKVKWRGCDATIWDTY